MCYHKALAKREQELAQHYGASFEHVRAELKLIESRFEVLLQKDEKLDALKALKEKSYNGIHEVLTQYSQKGGLPEHLTKQELSELKWCLKVMAGNSNDGVSMYHENGFDYLPTPIITAGDPDHFKLFNWGLVPFYISDRDKAMALRAQTLNCISEEMSEKPSFRDAVKNGQRCLIPVTGFFEWRWLDEKGTVKIPYYVTFRDQKVRSMAGLYSRWRDKETDTYYYSYTVLTTQANSILEYVHNHKKRMPVIIAKEDEKAWLNRDLKQKDVDELCRPSNDSSMRAYTISKLLTTKNTITNVPEVLLPMNYQEAIKTASHFLETGDKKRALESFKEIVSGEKISVEDLSHAINQNILPELSLT
ncbi:MAG: SOS response-associated peptidase [Cyclobacteriaceae bacterium]